MKAFCEPPITTSSPQPSISSGMVPSPVMASTTKMASVFLTIPAMVWTSCSAPVEVSEACMKTPLVRRLGFQRRFDAIGRNHVAVFGFENVCVESVSLGDFDPALAEFAGRRRQSLCRRAKTDWKPKRPSRRCRRPRNTARRSRCRTLLSGPPAPICRRFGILRCGGECPTPSWRAERADTEESGQVLKVVACECAWKGIRVFRISNAMSLLDQLQKDLVAAMKAKEEARLSALRMIKTALRKRRWIRPSRWTKPPSSRC